MTQTIAVEKITNEQVMHAAWDVLGQVTDELDNLNASRSARDTLSLVRSALFQSDLVKPMMVKRGPLAVVVEDAQQQMAAETLDNLLLLQHYLATR